MSCGRSSPPADEKCKCAWLKDKFGVSWQIVPQALRELIGDKDPVQSQRVSKAMLQMTKIDIEGLQRAYRGESTPDE
jgi:predicted 3-demethylubiquinone-9 3-methyltransferase (glyoxalase superfamily)